MTSEVSLQPAVPRRKWLTPQPWPLLPRQVHSDLTALDAIFQRREDGGARGGAVSARAAGGGSGGAAAAAAAASVRWKGTAGGGLRPEATVHTSARRLVDQARVGNGWARGE